MELQPVDLTDRVEPIPRLTEREAELLVVRDRALQIVDQELGAKDVTRGSVLSLVMSACAKAPSRPTASSPRPLTALDGAVGSARVGQHASLTASATRRS
jgi:hypothetical protein